MTSPPSATDALSRTRFASGLPKLSSDFVFNTRRSLFSDRRVREAIALLFDAEWVNRSYFFDLYRRSASFFDEFGIVGLSPGRRRSRT